MNGSRSRFGKQDRRYRRPSWRSRPSNPVRCRGALCRGAHARPSGSVVRSAHRHCCRVGRSPVGSLIPPPLRSICPGRRHPITGTVRGSSASSNSIGTPTHLVASRASTPGRGHSAQRSRKEQHRAVNRPSSATPPQRFPRDRTPARRPPVPRDAAGLVRGPIRIPNRSCAVAVPHAVHHGLGASRSRDDRRGCD